MSAAQDDVRRAFDVLLSEPVAPFEQDGALRMAAALWRFIHLRGFVTEGRRRLALTLARGQEPNTLRMPFSAARESSLRIRATSAPRG